MEKQIFLKQKRTFANSNYSWYNNVSRARTTNGNYFAWTHTRTKTTHSTVEEMLALDQGPLNMIYLYTSTGGKCIKDIVHILLCSIKSLLMYFMKNKESFSLSSGSWCSASLPPCVCTWYRDIFINTPVWYLNLSEIMIPLLFPLRIKIRCGGGF